MSAHTPRTARRAVVQLKMPPSAKLEIVAAAADHGMSVTQWATYILIERARTMPPPRTQEKRCGVCGHG